MVDLPTPPLPLATATTCSTFSMTRIDGDCSGEIGPLWFEKSSAIWTITVLKAPANFSFTASLTAFFFSVFWEVICNSMVTV